MNKIIVGCLVSVLVLSPLLVRGDDDGIIGVWNNQEKDAKIEIYRCGEKICGKIVSLKDPNYPEGSTDGPAGTPKVDNKNPDQKLRKTPLLGLDVVRNFVYDKNGVWIEGKVYDPKNGKTYSGKITLVSPNELKLRGFIGISLIGRTAVWTR
ncbi:MAG TPA: DUF2147 domain-containing protein [Nitrospirota bacterium]|nr:DUF2147 domain-containing protein [Nitrospirota bacterium]